MRCLNQVDIKHRSLTRYTARIIAPLSWRWGRIESELWKTLMNKHWKLFSHFCSFKAVRGKLKILALPRRGAACAAGPSTAPLPIKFTRGLKGFQNIWNLVYVVTFDTLSFVDTRFKKQYAQHGQHFEILCAFFFPLLLSFMHEVSEMMC